MDKRDLILGVDAGGTKTAAAVGFVDSQGRPQLLAKATAGPGNPVVIGLDGACRAIADAVRRATEQTPEASGTIASAVLAVAGAGCSDTRDQVEGWALRNLAADAVTVVTDVAPLLDVAGCSGPVLCVIAGTGSICVTRNAEGNVARTGGWGYLLGDEGSGYDIGRRLLRSVLTGEASERVTNAVLKCIGASHVSSAPAIVHAVAAPRNLIAGLATEACRHAADGDAGCISLLAASAKGLAEQATAACEAANLDGKPHPLVFAGSVVARSESYRRALIEAISRLGHAPERVEVVDDPSVAAMSMAARVGRR